jgi:hypothetical protein
MKTVYCYDRFATHKRFGATLALVAGGLLTLHLLAAAATPQRQPAMGISAQAAAAEPAVAATVTQLPRVVVVGRRATPALHSTLSARPSGGD